MPVQKHSGTSASSMARAPAGDDGSWEGWNRKWDKAATSSTQKSRGWKSSPQKTSKSGKGAELSAWHDREWHNKTGTWQGSWSWSTWNSSEKDPGPPGSPNNVDSKWQDVTGDGQDKDELEEDAALQGLESKQLFDGCLSVPPLTPRPPTDTWFPSPLPP